MIKLLTFDNLFYPLRHLAKSRNRVTTLRPPSFPAKMTLVQLSTEKNLIFVVVLVLESKGLW